MSIDRYMQLSWHSCTIHSSLVWNCPCDDEQFLDRPLPISSQHLGALSHHVVHCAAAQVEQVNEAMKRGVAKILDEEDSLSASSTPQTTAQSPNASSFADMWNLALSCAIGGPMDEYDTHPSYGSRQFQWKSHEPSPMKKGELR
jgi:hypothetical protein